ncbi:MAG: NADPH-dependent oxidoreductase [Frankiales bacterium]|nr:NADPH-dependent oxidoreductase [Frankiales bacterium]
MTQPAPLNVLALVCTLKRSPEPSSADRLARLMLQQFEGATTDVVRIVDEDVRPGLLDDLGDGDGWPAVRAKIDAADVLVVAGPIWNGQPASPFLQIPERLNAVLSQKDDAQRTPLFGKVAVVGVVGNEDGARHVQSIVMAALSELGMTFPAVPLAYHLGDDLVDQDEVEDADLELLTRVCSNAAHLARVLKASPYPGVPAA